MLNVIKIKDKKFSIKRKKDIINWYKQNTMLVEKPDISGEVGESYAVIVQKSLNNWDYLIGFGRTKKQALSELKNIVNEEIAIFTKYQVIPEKICNCFWKEFEK